LSGKRFNSWPSTGRKSGQTSAPAVAYVSAICCSCFPRDPLPPAEALSALEIAEKRLQTVRILLVYPVSIRAIWNDILLAERIAEAWMPEHEK